MKREPATSTQVIDVEARRGYASLLRSFVCGQMTNTQYEDRYGEFEFKDDAVDRIHSELVWLLYDDCYPHRLKGRHRVTKHGREYLSRAVLLLRSGLPAASDGVLASDGVFTHRLDFGVLLLLFVMSSPLLIAGLAFVPGFLFIALALGAVWLAVYLIPKFGSKSDVDEHIGDPIWPFRTEEDLVAAKRVPTFLCGRA